MLKRPLDLKPGDVMRHTGSRRGLGRKVVVTRVEDRGESLAAFVLYVQGDRSGHKHLAEAEGVTFLPKAIQITIEGRWKGNVAKRQRGMVEEVNQQGEANMATTKTAPKSSTSKKKGSSSKSKSASSKSKSNGGESKRASNEELDKQAAEVVKLRDEDELSWAEVETKTGIPASRLRALYNRGGGKPTRQRKGAAKKAAEAKSKSSSKKKTGTKGKKRPS